MQLLYYLLYCCFLVGFTATKHINVKLTDGSPIVGNLLRDGELEVGEFLGIPFAEPPTKYLRFMKPVAKKPWTTTLQCTKYRSACLQRKTPVFKLNVNTSEDCLYLNIWAPRRQGKEHLPVMAFIHGGAFQLGAASLTNGSILASRNGVTVVTMNYRIGIFGFLTIPNSKVTGNMGLWDQLLSLEWIQRNIAKFGGNPRKVTIFGESAGGASVCFQVLSPKAANLFHAAIAESGTPNGPWTTNTKAKADLLAKNLAETVDCNNSNPARTIDCLQAVDGSTLLNADQNPYTWYLPVADGEFLPDDPMKLVKSGQFNRVPLITGFNANEGWLMVAFMWPKMAEYNPNNSRSNFLTSDAMWNDAMNALTLGIQPANHPMIKKAIKHEYSRWIEPATAKVRQDSLDMLLSDHTFLCPMLDFAKYTANYTSTYVYKFNGIGRVSFPFPDWMGSLHMADLEYIFGMPTVMPQKYLPEEAQLAKDIQVSLSNFAKTGYFLAHYVVKSFSDPSIGSQKWSTYSEKTQQFMNFASSPVSGINQWLPIRRCSFWNGYIQDLENAVS